MMKYITINGRLSHDNSTKPMYKRSDLAVFLWEGAMIVHILIVIALLVCALQAVRAQRLLLSALWLAGASALVALLMYLLGAPEVAVIELSVGAGLVTVLFVFAINISGEEALALQPIIPRPLAWVLVISSVLLLGWMNADILSIQVEVHQAVQLQFKNVLWENRVLDLLLQMALIFSGVLGVLGLLAEGQPRPTVDEGIR
jgi:uncharacterized MnhB-related membrane protein